MRLVQSFLMCFGMLLIGMAIVFTASTAYANQLQPCVDARCGTCEGLKKFDSCPGLLCSCECAGAPLDCHA